MTGNFILEHVFLLILAGMRNGVYIGSMKLNFLSNSCSSAKTDHFHELEWLEFVREVDRLIKGNHVAKQLFFDARERYLANQN